MFLKQMICQRSKASKANMLVLRTSNFQGTTVRPIIPRRTTLYCLYCPPLDFLPRASSKSHYIIFNFLRWKPLQNSNIQFEKENRQKPTWSNFIFPLISPFLNRKISWKCTIHPGIFLRWALWADSVSPLVNTMASRDQFEPISIGENLVMNK